jgi:hypothetical protein
MAIHGFSEMKPSVRSVCIELSENEPAISVWRDGLTERQRQQWRHPLTITRKWREATQADDPCRPSDKPVATDLKRDAIAAWRKFVSCLESMAPSEGAPLKAMAAEFLSPHHCERDHDHHRSDEGRGLGV